MQAHAPLPPYYLARPIFPTEGSHPPSLPMIHSVVCMHRLQPPFSMGCAQHMVLRIKQLVAKGMRFLGRGSSDTPPLSATQELFCQWNAERLNISLEESRERFLASVRALPHGHGGKAFRRFCDLSYQIHRPFADDADREIDEAYRLHAPIHFLRMLAYDEPNWTETDPIVVALRQRQTAITIVDFGCGLAQRSRSLALTLAKGGQAVTLVLADLPTLRKPFLLWLAARTGIPTTFLDCSAHSPMPDLPQAHLCIATDVLEHLSSPLTALDALHRSLMPGGLLLADVHDHKAEYLHISPLLAPVRERLAALGYEPLAPQRLYRKPYATT